MLLYDGRLYCFDPAEDDGDANAGIAFGAVEVAEAASFSQAYEILLGTLHKGEERRRTVTAALVREPNNPDDPSTVGVYALDSSLDSHKVGNLPPRAAEAYLPAIRQLEQRLQSTVGCRADIFGKGKEALFGEPAYACTVLLPGPEEWLDYRTE